MTMNSQHGLWAVVADNDPTLTTVLGGISALSMKTNSEIRNEPRSNEVYPRFQSLVAQKPAGTFSTSAIAAALDLAGPTGLDIDGLSNGLHFYAQKGADGGSRAGATSHRKYVMADGILIPKTLTCEHQGDAKIDYEAVITYDGANDPITVTDSASLPAGITDAERFTLASTTIESEALDHLINFNLAFGIKARTEGAGSDIWDTIVTIEQIMGVLRLRGKDPTWFKSDVIPLTGKAVTHASTAVYLRKRAAGASFVADATLEHIKFTFAGMAVIETLLDAQGNATGETELMMPLYYDGTNDPMVIDTTSALP